MKYLRAGIIMLPLMSSLLFLDSCSLFKTNNPNAAICRQLKSEIIFAGSTSETRKANIQEADKPLLEKSYEDYHCDGE